MKVTEVSKINELSQMEELDKEASVDMAAIMQTFEYYEQGINPEMAIALNAHVKKYGDYQIWNYFGSPDGRDPDWFDSSTGQVKALKRIWVVA